MKHKDKKQQNTQNEAQPEKKSTLKILSSAALILALAANVVGLANYEPTDITSEDLSPTYVVEECIDMPPSVDELINPDDDEKQKKSARMSVSGVLSFVTAWLIGTVTNLFPQLLSALLTPLGTKVLDWLLFAAGVFIALILALKKVFPNVPLKQLLTKKRLLIIFALTVAIIAICEFAGYYFKEWILAIKIVSLILGFVLIIAIYHRLVCAWPFAHSKAK